MLLSCGLYKDSKLLVMGLNTRELHVNKAIHPKYFAEGAHDVTYKTDSGIVHEIFLLTYKEREILVFDYHTLE